LYITIEAGKTMCTWETAILIPYKMEHHRATPMKPHLANGNEDEAALSIRLAHLINPFPSLHVRAPHVVVSPRESSAV
jgi:hypothetical protein